MKRIFSSIIFLFSLFSASAQFFSSQDFHLNIEPTFSYSSGVLNESLYHSRDKNKRISLLEWERKLLLYGVQASGNFKKLHFRTGAELGIPSKSGEMRDSDWLNESDYAMKTTYSVGTNNADRNFNSVLAISYDFEPVRGFFIFPEMQAQYSFDSFYRKKGANGWYGQSEYSSDGKNHWWYEDEAEKFPHTYWNEEKGRFVTRKLAGIDYYRHSVYIWSGLGIAFLVNRLRVDAAFFVAPFTYFSAEDRHHTAADDNVLHEIQKDFFASYKLRLGFSYEVSRFVDISLRGEMVASSEIKGDLFLGWHKDSSQPTGASVRTASITAGVKMKIF